NEAIDAMLAEAAGSGDADLARSLELAVRYASEANFELLLGEVLKSRDWLDATAADAEDGFRRARQVDREAFELEGGGAQEAVCRDLEHLLSRRDLLRLHEALAGGSLQDQQTARRVDRMLAARDQAGRIATLRALFLTREGQERRSLFTSAVAARSPELVCIV